MFPQDVTLDQVCTELEKHLLLFLELVLIGHSSAFLHSRFLLLHIWFIFYNNVLLLATTPKQMWSTVNTVKNNMGLGWTSSAMMKILH